MTAADQKLSPNLQIVKNSDEKNGTKLVEHHGKFAADIGTDYNFKRKIVWKNALGFLALHLAALYGLYLCIYCKALTVIWMVFMVAVSGEGVTIGAHRLYSHKSFKARFPLRLLLIICQTIAGQNCLYIWVRDHRQHHKYSDTDADPHNASRGFFFSHMGWLMSRKHPLVIEKGKNIDMSDLEADWLVMFQKKFYKPLYAVFAVAIPVAIPVYFWNETYYNSLFIAYITRYVLLLNITWLVNSAAHLYGNKPFDKFMLPVESTFVAFVSIGEGWHNYHHTFPWDYRAAEFGSKYNVTTFLIDLFSHFNLAYDLKSTPYKLVQQRSLRTGDGTHPVFRKTKSQSDQKTEPSKTSLEENEVTYSKNKDSNYAKDVKQRVVAAHG